MTANTTDKGGRLTKVLVANRGEIARRVITAAHSLGMAAVAVFSDADARAPHVGEADGAVRLPGVRAADTYLDVEGIVGAALRAGADSLHPGYGFLAERAELAEACESAGIVFVGPPAGAIRSMARKVEAKALAASAGLPVLPTVVVAADPARAVVDVESAGVRYPVMVKASAGGGGSGIRRVDRPQELAAAVEVAEREAEAAFGDGSVFVEPLLDRPHHVEVQVLADRYGQVVHLFDRECSVQRRHQKVVEEAPSPNVGELLRERMCAAAVDLATRVGYVGAGTVEFLVDGGDFYFLEMNTRLQVEHRVTEAVTGVDLVVAQLLVAGGAPLERTQGSLDLSGSAIEARLYAEDPAAGYVPVTGTVEHYSHETGPPGVLFDDGIESGSVVPAYYDGLLAKIVAHGPTRAVAAGRAERAVRLIRLDGVRTNRDLLAAVLADADFLSGRIDTGYLERRGDLAAASLPAATVALHAAAGAFARAASGHATSPLSFAPLGWRNVGRSSSVVMFGQSSGSGSDVEVTLWRSGDGVRAGVDGAEYEVAPGAGPGSVDVSADGVVLRCHVRQHGAAWCVNSSSGQSDFEVRATPEGRSETAGHGAVATPVPGNVVRVAVSTGDSVSSGEVLVVVEAMKMEHRLVAPSKGVVASLSVCEGDVVEAHQVLVTVKAGPDDPAAERPPEP